MMDDKKDKKVTKDQQLHQELELKKIELGVSNSFFTDSDFIFYEPSLRDLFEAASFAEVGWTDLIVKMTGGSIYQNEINGDWFRFEDGWKKYNNQSLISNLITSLGEHYKNAEVEGELIKYFKGIAIALFNKKTRDAIKSNIKNDQLLTKIFDEKEHLIQLQNCIFNTSQLMPREKVSNLYLSKKMPIDYNPNAECPLFLKFMDQLFNYEKDTIEYVQRMFGSCLKAEPKKVFPIFWGAANNGKSTLFEVLKMIFGEYSCTVMPAVFLNGKDIQSRDRSSSQLVMQGKRLVFVSETGENHKINASALKSITGEDTISVRKLYSNDLVNIKPTWTIFLATNHPPFLSNDPALFARIRLIEMKNSFVSAPDPNDSHQFPVDLRIKEKLFEERSGILNWLIQGCKNFSERGLSVPKSIENTTRTYQNDSDYLGQYLEEKGLLVKGVLKAYRETCPEFHKLFRNWQIESGLSPYTPHRIIKEMKQKGFFKHKLSGILYYTKD